jgi:hypothetical protein
VEVAAEADHSGYHLDDLRPKREVRQRKGRRSNEAPGDVGALPLRARRRDATPAGASERACDLFRLQTWRKACAEEGAGPVRGRRERRHSRGREFRRRRVLAERNPDSLRLGAAAIQEEADTEPRFPAADTTTERSRDARVEVHRRLVDLTRVRPGSAGHPNHVHDRRRSDLGVVERVTQQRPHKETTVQQASGVPKFWRDLGGRNQKLCPPELRTLLFVPMVFTRNPGDFWKDCVHQGERSLRGVAAD